MAWRDSNEADRLAALALDAREGARPCSLGWQCSERGGAGARRGQCGCDGSGDGGHPCDNARPTSGPPRARPRS
eukprot:315998-Pyramimonas_sp.AAC.1